MKSFLKTNFFFGRFFMEIGDCFWKDYFENKADWGEINFCCRLDKDFLFCRRLFLKKNLKRIMKNLFEEICKGFVFWRIWNIMQGLKWEGENIYTKEYEKSFAGESTWEGSSFLTWKIKQSSDFFKKKIWRIMYREEEDQKIF